MYPLLNVLYDMYNKNIRRRVFMRKNAITRFLAMTTCCILGISSLTGCTNSSGSTNTAENATKWRDKYKSRGFRWWRR